MTISPRCPVCRWHLAFMPELGRGWIAGCPNCHCPVQDLPVTLHEHPIVDVLRQADRLTAREILERLGWRGGVDPVGHQLRRLAYHCVIRQSTDGSQTFRLEQPRLRPGEPC